MTEGDSQGKSETQKFECLYNEKGFLDEIKRISHKGYHLLNKTKIVDTSFKYLRTFGNTIVIKRNPYDPYQHLRWNS